MPENACFSHGDDRHYSELFHSQRDTIGTDQLYHLLAPASIHQVVSLADFGFPIMICDLSSVRSKVHLFWTSGLSHSHGSLITAFHTISGRGGRGGGTLTWSKDTYKLIESASSMVLSHETKALKHMVSLAAGRI